MPNIDWMVPLLLSLGGAALLLMTWVLLEQRFQSRLQAAVRAAKQQQQQKLAKEQAALEAARTELETQKKELDNLTPEQARQQVLEHWQAELSEERAKLLEAHLLSLNEEKAKHTTAILARSIQSQSASHAREKTKVELTLPDEKLRGRVIGKGGRNIQAFQNITGVDISLPADSVVLSCFDPLKLTLAERTLTALFKDGRIYPERIAEVHVLCQRELEKELPERAKKAAEAAGLTEPLPKKILPVLGRLYYQTSAGQNLLLHAQEVAQLAGILAQEIGADERVARRGGLLHDLGKAIPETPQSGSHTQRGVVLAKSCGESDAVVHTIAAHHRETPPATPEAFLVQAADTLSAARPGVRSENNQGNIQRVKDLEQLLHSFAGVERVVVLQSGHEVSVMVDPDEMTEAETEKLGHDIALCLREKHPELRTKISVLREWKGAHYL